MQSRCCLRLWFIWERCPVSEDRFDSKMSLCLRGVVTRPVFLRKAQFVLLSVVYGSVLMVKGERHGEKTNPEKALLTVDLATVGHILFWSLAISLCLCIWRHRLRRFIEIRLIGIVRWFSVLQFRSCCLAANSQQQVWLVYMSLSAVSLGF